MRSTATLDQLKPGHDYPGANLNARTSGRDENIDALAASILSEGLLQSLLVCPGPKGDSHLYVIAGNRRLLALQKLNHTGEIPVIVRDDVTPGSALAMSLAENVTQCPMHPVDRFETFAALVKAGKSEAEIAASYSIGDRVVKQSLALGRLAPVIRKAWRDGKIDAAEARAFTLTADQKAQEAVFKKLNNRWSAWNIRQQLVGDQSDTRRFMGIVGRAKYEAAGGKVQVDLFARQPNDKRDHDDDEDDDGSLLVSDLPLLIRLAGEAIAAKCVELKEAGWAWAEDKDDLPDNATYEYGGGWKRIATPKHNAPKDQKAISGCAVSVSHDGKWDIKYGLLKPGTKAAPAAGKKGDKPAAKPANKISNALRDRLAEQLTAATRDALKTQAGGATLASLLAGIVAGQINPGLPSRSPRQVSDALDTLRQRLPAAEFNAALARKFDRQGYFSGAPKLLVLKAITDGLGADHAARLKDKKKAEVWKFALANVPKTWLPPELRTTHYAGPGAKAAKAKKAKR